MGRRKREPMNPAKKNIVSELIKTYDIKTAKDIQEALKDLLGETLQDMLEAEMNEYLGYEKYSRDEDVQNSRSGLILLETGDQSSASYQSCSKNV